MMNKVVILSLVCFDFIKCDPILSESPSRKDGDYEYEYDDAIGVVPEGPVMCQLPQSFKYRTGNTSNFLFKKTKKHSNFDLF